MKLQVKSRRHRKGEQRRDVRDFCDKAIFIAENDDDARVLNKMYRIFMKVGTGGMNLIIGAGLQEIEDAERGKQK